MAERREELILKTEPTRDRHPVSRYLDGLAPGSRRTLRQALDRIASLLTRGRASADNLAWHKLRRRHATALRGTLLKNYSAATTNKMLSAFRGVMREACGLGYIAEADLRRMADLPSVRNDRLASGRTLGDRDLKALFATCRRGGGAAACRDAALLALLYGAGLRRSEAVALNTSDFDASSGVLRVRHDKKRLVHVESGARAALDAWLRMRGREAGALLCPVDKAGRVRVRHMTDQAVLYIVRRRASLAGIRRFSPHDLRRSFFFRQRRSHPATKSAGARRPGRPGRVEAQEPDRPVPTLPVPFHGCDG